MEWGFLSLFVINYSDNSIRDKIIRRNRDGLIKGIIFTDLYCDFNLSMEFLFSWNLLISFLSLIRCLEIYFSFFLKLTNLIVE